MDENIRVMEAATGEETVRALLNSATNTAIFLIDTTGTILTFNTTFTQFIDKPAEGLGGRCVYDLLPPEVANHCKVHVDEMIYSGQPVYWEEQIGVRWFCLSLYPVYSTVGVVTQVAVYALDITERAQVEQEIRRVNRNLEDCVAERTAELRAINKALQIEIDERRQAEAALEERIRFEILLSDLSTAFINLSVAEIDRAIMGGLQRIVELLDFDRCTLSQFSEGSAHLRVTHSYVAPGRRPVPLITLNEALPSFTDAIHRGEIYTLNQLFANTSEQSSRDRAYIQAEEIKSFLGIPLIVDKRVLGVIIFVSFRHEDNWADDQVQRFRLIGEVFANILARKQAEEALQVSEERFRSTFEQAAVGLIHLGLRGQFLRVNQQFCTITGYTPAELLARTFQEITYLPELETDLVRARQMMAGQLSACEAEKRFVRKNGSLAWVYLTCSLARRPDGAPDYFIIAVRDITARRQLEQRLAAVYQLGQELPLLHDEVAIIQRVLVTATTLLGFELAGYGRVNNTTQELEYCYILLGSELQNSPLRLSLQDERGFGVVVARNGQPLLVADTRLDKRYVSGPGDWTGLSTLTVPLKISDRIIGVLNIESSQLNHFTPADQQILQTLADQMAVALENADLLTTLQRRTHELVTINRAARAVTSSLELKAVLEQVITEVKGILEADAASVLLRRPASEELEFAIVAGSKAEQLVGMRLPLKAGIAGWVVRERRAALVEDAQVDPRFYDQVDWLTQLTTRALLAVPLLVKEEVIGVIEALNLVPGSFQPYELYLLETLAGSAAVAIENARLYDETKQWARRMAVLHDLDQAINASLRLNDVYEAFIDHAYHLLPADHISIILREGEHIRVIYVRSKTGGILSPGNTYPIDASTSVGWVIRHGQLLLRRNFAVDSGFTDDEYSLSLGLHSGMIIPLQVKGRVIGTWTIGSQQKDAYQSEEATIAQAMADPLAIAIENAQLFEQIEQEVVERKRAEAEIQQLSTELEQRVEDRTRELAALYRVTAVASEPLELERLLERLLEQALIAMRSQVGVIHTWDETGQVLRLDVQQGLPPPILAQLQRAPVNDNLPGWVIKHGEPLLLADDTANLYTPPTWEWGQLQTYVGVPMRTAGQSLGVLSVFGQAGQRFSPEEVALLASIGDQVGVVIENIKLRQRAKQAAIMEERERLARDLHDSVTQSLYSLMLLAGGGQRLARKGQLDNLDTYLGNLVQVAHQALKEMRLLIYQLRPSFLAEQGLVGALQQRLEAVEKRANLQTGLKVEGPLELPVYIEVELYRIAQEALNNALKHAQATMVTISLRSSGRQVELEVTDNGNGFDSAAIQKTGGMGLANMHERAENLGGSLTVLSGQGSGTTLKVTVPLTNQ